MRRLPIVLAITTCSFLIILFLVLWDSEKPEITISYPLERSLSLSGNVSIYGLASDGKSGIREVRIRVNDEDNFTARPASANLSEWISDVYIPKSGLYKITAIVTDNAGNESFDSKWIIIEDRKDKFGIEKILPTLTSQPRKVWFSNWDNGIKRTLDKAGESDPYDPEVELHGKGIVTLDGSGNAIVKGSPRLYVLDPNRKEKWHNVEITFYLKLVRESSSAASFSGFTISTRTEHQDIDFDNDKTFCKGAGIFARVYSDGRIAFLKEMIHSISYSSTRPIQHLKYWNNSDGSLPLGTWIGIKFVARNIDSNTHVKLELYRDLTDGNDGGNWKKVIEYTDVGGWKDPSRNAPSCPGYDLDRILLEPGTSTYFRIDDVTRAELKKASIREIAPLP